MGNTIEFKVNQTEIPGLLEINIDRHEDNRGWFQEKFQKAKLLEQGFPQDYIPVQHNISYNKEVGVTRGIHAEPFRKYITVIKGSVVSAFVDLRPGNNFGKTILIKIDEGKAIFLPTGVGSSFQTLEPDTYYSYLWDGHWSPDKLNEYKYVNLFDPELAIQWPIGLDSAIISDKDRNHPNLSDIKPFEDLSR